MPARQKQKRKHRNEFSRNAGLEKNWHDYDLVEQKEHLNEAADEIDLIRSRLDESAAKERLQSASRTDTEIFEALRKYEHNLEFILCLGIGSLREKPAQYQLAFLMMLRRGLECTVSIFDPLFDARDLALVRHLGMQAPLENKCGHYTLDRPTFVYMPRCPRELYESLLRANWTELLLRQMVLCGNDLDHYNAMDTYPAMTRISQHYYRYAMPSYEEAPLGVLDAVLHTFFAPLELSPELDTGAGWSYKAAPTNRRRRTRRANIEDLTTAMNETTLEDFWSLPPEAHHESEVIQTPIVIS
ncbi:hypothetical protein MYAM1_001812 [Malassezia yamatoensis]|uniref:SRR1-like domain-containing protein n=1 Tax=Malassezia yamatoensis TaxID=253288 RepID=A0AAJ5YSQ0_9BASI|nr:hypothetical protein MYAM1_001812 [Malassezia yamatoensis]